MLRISFSYTIKRDFECILVVVKGLHTPDASNRCRISVALLGSRTLLRCQNEEVLAF